MLPGCLNNVSQPMEVFKTACYAKCVKLKPQKQQEKKPAESQLRDCLKTKLIKKTSSQSVRNKDSAGTKQNKTTYMF